MSAEGVPTYSAGDTIRVCVVVRPWPAGKGICRIRATFAHEADPTKEIELSDDPESAVLMRRCRRRTTWN